MEWSPVVLRNKGVPVELAKVEPDPDRPGRYRTILDANSEPEREEVWIRFTANEISEIEEVFTGVTFTLNEPVYEAVSEVDMDGNETTVRRATGEYRQVIRSFNGLEGFSEASKHKPADTVRRSLALALGRPVDQVGAAMLPEKFQEYTMATNAAFAIATGTPAETVGKALEIQRVEAKRALEAAIAEADTELDKMTSATDSPGPTGSPPGSEIPSLEESAEASTSSGA